MPPLPASWEKKEVGTEGAEAAVTVVEEEETAEEVGPCGCLNEGCMKCGCVSLTPKLPPSVPLAPVTVEETLDAIGLKYVRNISQNEYASMRKPTLTKKEVATGYAQLQTFLCATRSESNTRMYSVDITLSRRRESHGHYKCLGTWRHW